MSLSPGPLTYSRDRLREVWREGQFVRGRFRIDGYQSFEYDSNHNLKYPRPARKFCLRLYSAVQDPKNHLTELDSHFDPISSRPFMKTSLSESVVLDRACRLLCQLPATPPDILDALPFNLELLREYQQSSPDIETRNDAQQISEWTQVRVVCHVSDYILRFALHAAVVELSDEGHGLAFNGGPVTDSILVLLHLSLQISAEKGMQDAKWLIICAFLWTSWQRSLMLHLWTCMASQLGGFNYESGRSLHRKGLDLLPDIWRLQSQRNLEGLRRIPYLCGWAFRSLRNDLSNIAMDLRYFQELYHNYFGERPPVCNPGPTQCDGSSSHNCKRFKNTVARNQSMHDYKCEGSCQRLFWSRESFLGVPGPKAVDIAATASDELRYCPVNEGTLTVSHVWSHGQGGRPDNVGPEGTGFNVCLHRRYVDIATSLGCKSYWMDTACIPSEKELRWECVSQITSIFATSGKIIICDRDIMDIDISNPTVHAYESVLATMLVCDWGIRAWTLLEAMRGRYGLFVLCRHNRFVNLHQLLESVHDNGRMELTNLFLTRDYLFPPMAISGFELFPGKVITSEVEREIEEGFVNIGAAAALLNHRHATRDGDDLLIWGLLIGDTEDESPIGMWERQVGKRIPTGSLISSARRIEGHPGLGWAPSSPTALQRTHQDGTDSKVYPAYARQETSKGLITSEGLRAKWLVYEFPNITNSSRDENGTQAPDFPVPCKCASIQYLCGYNWGLLLQAMPRSGPRTVPVAYRESVGRVVVVCASLDKVVWEWKGVYEWDANIALPKFTIAEILIR